MSQSNLFFLIVLFLFLRTAYCNGRAGKEEMDREERLLFINALKDSPLVRDFLANIELIGAMSKALKTYLEQRKQNDLTTRLDKLEGTLTNVTTRLDKLEGTLTNVTTRLDKLEGTLTNVTTRLDKIDGKLFNKNFTIRDTNGNDCVTKCGFHEKKSYSWCYIDVSWQHWGYCSIAPNLDIYGKPCSTPCSKSVTAEIYTCVLIGGTDSYCSPSPALSDKPPTSEAVGGQDDNETRRRRNREGGQSTDTF